MTANAWEFYNPFKHHMANGTCDLDTDNFKMLLTKNTYNFNNAHNNLADIDTANNEVTGNNYSRFNHNATWTGIAGTATFDVDDATYTASGGSIVCRRAIIFDDTAATDPVVVSSLLDNTPADVTVTTGNTLTVQINASGVFTLT